MTTTSGYFGSVYQSGSGLNWSNISTVGLGGEANCTGLIAIPGSPNEISMSSPNALSGVASGSQFQSMKITFRDKLERSGGANDVKLKGYINGVAVTGTTFNFVPSTGYVLRTFSGDASYWGIGAYSAKDILSALQSGQLRFIYDTNPNVTNNYTAYIKDVVCEVTYALVDTKRAAIKQCVA